MYRFVTALSVLLLALPVLAGFTSESNGTDGVFNPQVDIQIDLALAASLCDCDIDPKTPDVPCQASCPSPVPGQGVYDAGEWAVVFNYTTIDIPAGVTVTFHNHPKGAPVMWLAAGDVNIAGTVSLDGADGSVGVGSSYAIPGPGGFSGGIGREGQSAGFGPGGGSIIGSAGGGGGYGEAGTGAPTGGGVTYGTASIVPLIGGSGGSATIFGAPGGAGGGAILIASSGNIFLPDSFGGIFAKGGEGFLTSGGSGAGSGGGIRLIANVISGSGMLRALGGTGGMDGGFGRIRVEANSDMLEDKGDPLYTIGPPGLVFPDPTTAPSLRVTAINSNPVPVDPLATVVSEDVAFTTDLPVTLDIEAQNVPAGLIVNVRIVQARGGASTVVFSTPLEPAGEGITTATAEFEFPTGGWEVQLSVQLP